MKKLIGLVVIVAALVLGGYYSTGVITERTLKKNAIMINQSHGLYLDIQQYDRGWFTSMAKFHWKLNIPERVVKNSDGQSTTAPAQVYELDMPLKIYHGPVIFADSTVKFGLGYADTAMVLPPPTAKEFTKTFNDMFTSDSIKPEVKTSVLVNYLNRSRLRIEIPSFKLIGKNNSGTFEWLGFTNEVTLSSNLGKIDGDITVDGMKFAKDTTTAAFGKITSDYSLHETKEGLYLGEASLSTPSLVVADNGEKVFELEQFEVQSSSDVDGGLFNSYFETSLDKVTANNKSYGPGVLKMSLKNLDAQVLAQINQQVNQMQQGTDSERQQAAMQLLPELPKLFSKGAEFQLSELSLVMQEGKVEGTLIVSLPKGEISNPFQLIQKIQGEGKVKIPAAIVRQLMLETVKQQLKKPTLHQAMVDQMQQNQTQSATTKTDASPATAQQEGSARAVSDNPPLPADGKPIAPELGLGESEIQAQPAAQPTEPQQSVQSPADLEQKANAQTDEKLANLVQAGLLVTKGDDYVVEFKLVDGQLTVNGQPFNPATMKF